MANIAEMEGMSSPGGFSDVGIEASPMSSIISDLSRSTLDSGGAKKHPFQRSKGKSRLRKCWVDAKDLLYFSSKVGNKIRGSEVIFIKATIAKFIINI